MSRSVGRSEESSPAKMSDHSNHGVQLSGILCDNNNKTVGKDEKGIKTKRSLSVTTIPQQHKWKQKTALDRKDQPVLRNNGNGHSTRLLDCIERVAYREDDVHILIDKTADDATFAKNGSACILLPNDHRILCRMG